MATTAQPDSERNTVERKNANLVTALQTAYSMELESVCNYLADSVNLDGVRAEEVKEYLAKDVQEELGHATRLANRIKQLGGHVPGSNALALHHSHLDETNETTEVVTVIEAVIKDEAAAIEHYKRTIRDCDERDYVTQDLCLQLLADEERHLTQFRGFLKEYHSVAETASNVPQQDP